ncbi:zinc-binding alcohol dehydrogenase family protein [Streptomyces sp. NPDC006355]|uniref:quinone oxidoreductase family protein n=1 Tax=Streptomyces sp. NPDC006355 TaxID=3156758 RepID=UPI0033BAC555
MQIQDLEPEERRPGTVRVAVRAAGVNRSDVLACRGIIPGPYPRTLGRDFAGIVVDGPDHLIGQRVWGSGGGLLGLSTNGTHATFVDVPEDGISPIPSGLDDVHAAASALAYVTAYHALERAGTFTEGDTVVVTGAAGGVGGAAASLAGHRGARVIGVVKDAEEAAALSATPEGKLFAALVPTSIDDFPEVLAEHAAEARVAVDVIGGAVLPGVLTAMGIGGGVCLLGAPVGQTAAVDTLAFYRQELRLVGLHTGRLSSAEAARALRESADGFSSGRLHPSPVAGTYPLEDAVLAYQMVERGVAGRPVLLPHSAM